MQEDMAHNNQLFADSPYAEYDEAEQIAAVLQEFDTKFPTEKDCMEEICRLLDMSKFTKCRYCESLDVERFYGSRVIRCNICKKKTWITGGTFFHRIRRARPWLLAIWFMENGITIGSCRFHKLIGVAQSSSLYIFKKITTALERQMQDQKIPSRQLLRLFCKRSRETPARKHPVSEQDEIEKEKKDAGSEQIKERNEQGNTELNCEEPCFGDENEKILYECLSSEPMNVDVLSEKTGLQIKDLLVTLTMLELAGLAKRIVGDRYIRSSKMEVMAQLENEEGDDNCLKNKGHEKIRSLVHSNGYSNSRKSLKRGARARVADCLKYVRHYFHGVSRKYVQHYLAAYWCYLDRARWSNGSLVQACILVGQLDPSDIFDYISPLLVKMHGAIVL